MKKKYYRLLSVGMILGAVGLVSIYYFGGFWQVHQRVRLGPMPQMSNIAVPDQATVIQMQQLKRRMERLVQPPMPDLTGVNLSLFGYHSINSPAARPPVNRAGLPVPMDYRLSLTFISSTHKVCVIDGSLYAEDGVLEDGARILKIEADRVLIQKEKLEKWIHTSATMEKTNGDAVQDRKKSDPS